MSTESLVFGMVAVAVFVIAAVILGSIVNGLAAEALEASTMASQVIIEGGFRE